MTNLYSYNYCLLMCKSDYLPMSMVRKVYTMTPKQRLNYSSSWNRHIEIVPACDFCDH